MTEEQLSISLLTEQRDALREELKRAKSALWRIRNIAQHGFLHKHENSCDRIMAVVDSYGASTSLEPSSVDNSHRGNPGMRQAIVDGSAEYERLIRR